VIHVPSEQPTIQAGIDAAVDGDTVLVADGTYIGTGNVNISFNGKSILVTSENGPEATIIDCESSSRGFVFLSNEDSTSELSGFTITRGQGTVWPGGGGVYAHSASPKITNCIFYDNYAWDGAGIYCDSSGLILINCQFLDNDADNVGAGGGIYCKSSSLQISSCLFDHNRWNGGAIHCSDNSQLIIDSTEFIGNCLSTWASAGLDIRNSSATISHTTFVGNDGYQGGAIRVQLESSLVLSSCSFFGNRSENGPAILSLSSEVVAADCVFKDNLGYGATCGAMSASGSDVEFYGCQFIHNMTGGPKSGFDEKNERGGGAINLGSTTGLIVDCVFIENSICPTYPVWGGGAVRLESSSPAIENCTFVGNSDVTEGGGTLQCIGSSPVISNCIFAFNQAGVAIACSDSISSPILTCTDIYGNVDGDWVGCIADQNESDGNFSIGPLFCDTTSEDFHLSDLSACLPENNSCGFLIGTFGLGCTTGQPVALNVNLGEEAQMNVVDHTPTIFWSYTDTLSTAQYSFEIEIGSDTDWTVAELWASAEIVSSDTSVTCTGLPLADGEPYFIRLRVNNGQKWSPWTESTFRMNSVPSYPSPESPVLDEIVFSLNPALTVLNATDAEDDSLYYTFEVSPDSFTATMYSFTKQEDIGETTTLAVDSTLVENQRYWWRAKASDYYEESEYSEFATFFVNSENSAPSTFSLIWPPDTSGAPVETLAPELSWSASSDPDPLDSVIYELWIAIDADFTFVHQVPDIHYVSYVLIDSLDWGADYWWKVRADDQNGASTWSNVLSFRTVTLGDADASGEIDIDDVVYLLNYIFSGGLPPTPEFAGDADCSGAIDIDDVVYLISYIFAGGPSPCDPNGDEMPDC